MYDWNYFSFTANGLTFHQILISCSPGEWPEIRDSLSGPQPWDERAHGDPQVHDPAAWSVSRKGLCEQALSPPFGPAIGTVRGLTLGRGSLAPDPALVSADDLGRDDRTG
jgi:hypothetical protein